jgi:hypothetical protein
VGGGGGGRRRCGPGAVRPSRRAFWQGQQHSSRSVPTGAEAKVDIVAVRFGKVSTLRRPVSVSTGVEADVTFEGIEEETLVGD